jgi:hypothetical protein
VKLCRTYGYLHRLVSERAEHANNSYLRVDCSILGVAGLHIIRLLEEPAVSISMASNRSIY